MIECAVVGGFANRMKRLLTAGLRQGAPLELRQEQDNPYDPLATAVWLADGATVMQWLTEESQAELSTELAQCTGMPVHEALALLQAEGIPATSIGYLGKDTNKTVTLNGLMGNGRLRARAAQWQWPLQATWGFAATGVPIALVPEQ